MITTLTLNTYEGVHEHDADACVYNSLLCAWQNITVPEPYQAGETSRMNPPRWLPLGFTTGFEIYQELYRDRRGYSRLAPNLWRAN